MAHLRKRYLKSKYDELVKFSPLIGILGHRQVGKTTFLESNVKHYFTLDDEDTLNEVKKSAKNFINSLPQPLTAIDESQYAESIFPALKEKVRINKRPGQFILSGSVRFTSKASIRESLTGRIQYLELLPLTISEIQNEPFSRKLQTLLSTENIPALVTQFNTSSKTMIFFEKELEHYRIKGGLPGLCFIRKDQTRNDKILDQLKTILDRDLRQIYSSQLPFNTMINFLKEISLNEGNSYHYQHYKRKLKLSPITQKKLLNALESIFMIRPIPIEGGKAGVSYLLEDQAESNFLSKNQLPIESQYIHLLYRNLRAESYYQTKTLIDVFRFMTKNGKSVPIAFRSNDSCVGFIFTHDDHISRENKGTAASFLKFYANSKIVFVSLNRKVEQIDNRSLLCPLSCLI